MNARKELLDKVEPKDILCASINFYDGYREKQIILPLNWSDEDMYYFLVALDFEYNNGYGMQELFGNVWMKNGTWLEREEYDGSECWKHKVCPPIPSHCVKEEGIEGWDYPADNGNDNEPLE